MTARGNQKQTEPPYYTCRYMHGQEQELKQETTAVSACYVPVFLKKKNNNARKAVWFTKATVAGAISAFADSIDSHFILRISVSQKRYGTEILCTGFSDPQNIILLSVVLMNSYSCFKSKQFRRMCNFSFRPHIRSLAAKLNSMGLKIKPHQRNFGVNSP